MRYRFGRYELDEETGELRRDGEAVALQPKPFALLRILLRERDRVVSGDELFAALWPEVTVTASSLARAVSLARRAIGDTHRGERIRSVPRLGYRFVGEVIEIGRARPAVGAAGPGAAEPAAAGPALDPHAGEPFVGRAGALRALREAWQRAASGAGGLALVSGAPGIGKTRLVERFASEVERAGGAVLVGRCREDVPAFWPFAQVLRALLARGADPAALAALTESAAELAFLLPELGSPADRAPAAVSPGQQRFLLFDGVTRALLRESRRDPLLLVLEDLHWAGDSSLRMLEHLAYEIADAPILVVATVRDEPRPREHPVEQVLPLLRRQPRCLELPLDRLARRDVAELLEQVLGRAAPPDLTSELFAHSEGVPLFLREAIRLLSSRGDLQHPERARRWALTLPARARDLIQRPLDRLSPGCSDLVRAGAVLGREFTLALATAVAEVPRDVALDLLDEAERAGVLEAAPEAPGSWRFAHALFREAAAEAIPTGTRARLHARAADELTALHAGDPERAVAAVATHLHAALGVVDPARACEVAIRAARRAASLLAHDRAASHYEQALAAQDQIRGGDPALRIETLLDLGEALRLAGDRDRRRAVFAEAMDRAAEHGQPIQAARAAIGFCDLSDWAADDAEAATRVEAAFGQVPEAAALERAGLLTRLAYLSLRRDGERSLRLAREAVDAARRTGDAGVLQEALYALLFRLAGPDHLKERAALAEEAVAAARASRLEDTTLIAMLDVACDSIAQGDLAGAQRWRTQVSQVVGGEPHPVLLWHVRTFDAGAAIAQGRFAEGERLLAEGARLGERIGHPYARGVARGMQVWLLRERGRHAEVLDIFPPRRPVRMGPRQWVQAIIGRSLVAAGRPDEALAHYQDLVARGPSAIPRNIRWQATLAELAHLCADLGDAERADAFVEVLEPVAEQHGVLPLPIFYSGPLAACLGRLHALRGRLHEAERCFEAALASVETLGARPAQVRVLRDLAALLARIGETARAREVREQAAALAAELGGAGNAAA
jgi:DNA-binding winged helix-turn-helix (wHTH) protein/tetratricopeptide (TPR) repeat protein